jgi:hypothetical protein
LVLAAELPDTGIVPLMLDNGFGLEAFALEEAPPDGVPTPTTKKRLLTNLVFLLLCSC